jgi:hypothetical protein
MMTNPTSSIHLDMSVYKERANKTEQQEKTIKEQTDKIQDLKIESTDIEKLRPSKSHSACSKNVQTTTFVGRYAKAGRICQG